MRASKLAFLSALALYFAITQTAFAKEQRNCNLQSPPKSAKRIPTHGVDFIVYPPTVERSYTGCQILWLEDGRLLSTTFFRDGSAVWMKGKEPKGPSFYCAFDQGKLIPDKSDVQHCPETIKPQQ